MPPRAPIIEGQRAVNPATGERIVYRGGQWHPADATPLPRTEDQGKTQGYAVLMNQAEQAYQRARTDGYNPTTWRNGLAGALDGIPVVNGLAPIIRDEVSDRGRRAELQWSEGQLRAMTGSAATPGEIINNTRTFFPTNGVDINDPESVADFERGRETAFGGVQTRAGPAAAHLRYPGPTNRSRAGMVPAAVAGINAAAFGPLQNRYPPRQQGRGYRILSVE